MTAIMDNNQIDKIIDSHEGKRNSLIQVLLEVQSHHHWLPREVLERVGQRLGVPLSEVLQIATFYKTFRLVPPGRIDVHICMGSACHVRGATGVLSKIQDLIGIKAGETDPGSKFSLATSNCLGCCNLGPEIIINGKHHGKITPSKAEDVLKSHD